MQRGLTSPIGASHSAGIRLLEDWGQQVLIGANHSLLLFPLLPLAEHLCRHSGSLGSRQAPQTRPLLHPVFLPWQSSHVVFVMFIFDVLSVQGSANYGW